MNLSGMLMNPVFLACIAFALTGVFSGTVNWIALGAWRRTAGQHWTERARALYTVRRASGLNGALVVVVAFVTGAVISDSFSDSFPWWALIGAFFGCLAGYYPLQRAIFPGRAIKAWIAAVAFQLSLQVFSFGLFFACVYGMPRAFGLTTWLIAGGWLAIQLALEFGLWLNLLRFLRLLLPPSARLTRIASEASARSGIPIRAVWESVGAASQALVFLVTRTLVFTRPLLERLSDAELESICLHELAHLTEPKPIFRLRMLGRFSQLPLLFVVPLTARFGPGAAFALLVLTFVIPLGLLRVRHRMEQRADRLTVSATADPAVYARALEKIHAANQIPAVLGGRHTHPDLYDRMLAAGVTPDYPRPARPKRFHWTSGVLVVLVVAIFVALVVFD